MSSSIVKDPSTSYKLLPCCRARQANRPMWCMRGGSFTQGCQSSLHCPGEMLLEIIPMQGRVSFVLGTSPESPSFVRQDRGLMHPELRVPCTRRQSTAAGVAVGSFAQGVGGISAPCFGSISVPCTGDISVLCPGLLQFSPASRGGRQSCRPVPSIAAASLLLAVPRHLPARLGALFARLPPQTTYTTSSPAWQAGVCPLL